MAIELAIPTVDDLGAVARVLSTWQADGLPLRLHRGDLGWAWQVGASTLASRLRTWSRDGQISAIGFLDGPSLLRVAVEPEAGQDAELAAAMIVDLSSPSRGVLRPGEASVEVRLGDALRDGLKAEGWVHGELRTPLARDLAHRVEDPGLRVEVVGPNDVPARVAVQNSSFCSSRFTQERWHSMAGGPLCAGARCLMGYDDGGRPVAVATVWSAAAGSSATGRPGLIDLWACADTTVAGGMRRPSLWPRQQPSRSLVPAAPSSAPKPSTPER